MRQAILVGLLFWAAVAGAQTPAQFADNAKRVAAEFERPTVSIQENAPGKFHRLTNKLDGTSWDVKKTDSMLNPVQAVVKTTIVGGVSAELTAREDAERADSPIVGATKVELTYVPSATGWTFLEGRLYAEPLRTWIPVAHAKCGEGKGAYMCAVVDSFAVKK